MVLIAERTIKAKYHICDINEFVCYLLIHTATTHARAYCFVIFFFFYLFFIFRILSMYCMCWDTCNKIGLQYLFTYFKPGTSTVHVAKYLTCVRWFHSLLPMIYIEHSVTLIHAQDIHTHKPTHMQNTSHVYSCLAALISCPVLLKHYCTIKYTVVNQVKNANKL